MNCKENTLKTKSAHTFKVGGNATDINTDAITDSTHKQKLIKNSQQFKDKMTLEENYNIGSTSVIEHSLNRKENRLSNTNTEAPSLT